MGRRATRRRGAEIGNRKERQQRIRIRSKVAGTAARNNEPATRHCRIDGSDPIGDWPILNALLACSTGADLVAVHANVGRMMSADPTVPEPANSQAWNRYSYVINNPLAYTDPSGHSWLSEGINFVVCQELCIIRIEGDTLCRE